METGRKRRKEDGGSPSPSGNKNGPSGKSKGAGPGQGMGKPRNMGAALRRLATYAGPHWPAVAAIVIMVVTSTALALVPPWLLRYGIDELVIGNQPQYLWMLAVAMVAVVLLQGLVDFGTRYTSEYVSQNIIHDIRNELYEHLNRLSFAFYDWSRTGDIMSRVTADADALR